MQKEQIFIVEIIDARLKMCHITVSPAVLVGHKEALNDGPAIYPYIATDIRAITLPKDISNRSLDDIFNGRIPSKLILGLVESKAYVGDYKKKSIQLQTLQLVYNFYAT